MYFNTEKLKMILGYVILFALILIPSVWVAIKTGLAVNVLGIIGMVFLILLIATIATKLIGK